MSPTPGSNKLHFFKMDPSTTPVAAGADHGNTVIVAVNQPVIVVWFPGAGFGPTKGEIEPPDANWRVVVTDGPRVGLTVVVAREVNQLLRVVFNGRRQSGRLDLEAVERAMRAAMHQAGAAALSQLLRCEPPGPDHRQIACPCGRWHFTSLERENHHG